MESKALNVQVDENDKNDIEQFCSIVYEKLKESELEMNNTSKRYTINDVESSMNNIINNK